jgi:hypothetical protein
MGHAYRPGAALSMVTPVTVAVAAGDVHLPDDP